jgi:hypothetical protein
MCSKFNGWMRLVKRQDSRAAVHLFPSSLVSSTGLFSYLMYLFNLFISGQSQQATYVIRVLFDPAYLWDLLLSAVNNDHMTTDMYNVHQGHQLYSAILEKSSFTGGGGGRWLTANFSTHLFYEGHYLTSGLTLQ